MTVKILAFGIAKEIIGGASVSMALPEETDAETFKRVLAAQYPGLGRLSSFMIALNGVYAAASDIIGSDDEIAIIPPVSGG